MTVYRALIAIFAFIYISGVWAEEAWDCEGEIYPPSGGWWQETAFVEEADGQGRELALERAREQLLDRLCSDSHRMDCHLLEEKIRDWKTGHGQGFYCAMVVIKKSEVQAWKERYETHLRQFDLSLSKVASFLVTKQKHIAMGKIEDLGVHGGMRAEWMISRMESVLSHLGIDLIELPEDWKGAQMPRGIDGILTAKIVERPGKDETQVEVIWKLKTYQRGSWRFKTAQPFSFPAWIAPEVDQSMVPLPQNLEHFSMVLETRKGGGLCFGDRTQLRLTALDGDYEIRVIDLYGKDKGMLIFPNAAHPKGKILKGETLALGGEDGFIAIPDEDGVFVERFVVIAAKDPKDLGKFRDLRELCKLPQSWSRALHQNKGFPSKAIVTSEGFRFLPQDQCPELFMDLEEIYTQLAELPECKP